MDDTDEITTMAHARSVVKREYDGAVNSIIKLDAVLKQAGAGHMPWREAISKCKSVAAAICRVIAFFKSFFQEFLVEAKAFHDEVKGGSVNLEEAVNEWSTEIRSSYRLGRYLWGCIESLEEIYDNQMYHRFLQTHREEPDHEIWELYPSFENISFAAMDLCAMARTACSLADASRIKLNDEVDKIIIKHAEEPVVIHEAGTGYRNYSFSSSDWSEPSTNGDEEEYTTRPKEQDLEIVIAKAPPVESNTAPANSTSKSFSAVEDQVNRHKRAVTSSNYTTLQAPRASESTTVGEPRLASVKRNGRSVPRIFTGSFSELRKGLQNMKIGEENPGEVKTARSDPLSGKRPMAVTSSFPSSPAFSVQNRKTFKQQSVQDSVLDDRCRPPERVPSDLIRAQTLNEATGGLEAWFKERPPSKSRQDMF